PAARTVPRRRGCLLPSSRDQGRGRRPSPASCDRRRSHHRRLAGVVDGNRSRRGRPNGDASVHLALGEFALILRPPRVSQCRIRRLLVAIAVAVATLPVAAFAQTPTAPSASATPDSLSADSLAARLSACIPASWCRTGTTW